MSGVLAAVEAAVRAGGTRDDVVARMLRPAGVVTEADVSDALATLRALGVVRREPGRGWAPGAHGLTDLPGVSVEELERSWWTARRRRGTARGRLHE